MKTNTSSATWSGELKSGSGTISTESGALAGIPFSFATRFEGARGTNPEELVGAAHAACFSMALSGELQKLKLRPERIETEARVDLDKTESGFSVVAVRLKVKAVVPGATPEQFQQAAQTTKDTCPISRLLKANITLEAQLAGSSERAA